MRATSDGEMTGRESPEEDSMWCSPSKKDLKSVDEMFGNKAGPLETEAYVCKEKGAKLTLETITLPALGATEVECDMICCGLCHTDAHMCSNDWGISDYPIVPGHEGVGLIRAIGASVKTHKVGDRVAVTWIRDSCMDCNSCMVGRENICRCGYQGTYLAGSAGVFGKEAYNEHGGAFSKVCRIEAKFAIKIPENVPDEIACPLLCGGGTVFEPIVDYCEPGTKLGVAGIGGLGTAAIKLARLRGVTVTAISSSPHKKDAALAAGASDFISINDEDDLKKHAGTLDVIIDTSPVNSQPTSKYLDLVCFNGIYCRVGLPPGTDQTFKYDFLPLIFTQKKIVGSIVTGSARMKSMLDLVSANLDFMLRDNPDMHQVEKIPFHQVNDAINNLVTRNNKGFRYMLVW